MNVVRKIGKGMLALVVLMLVMLVVRGLMDARVDYDVTTAGLSIPQYDSIEVPFEQSNDFSSAHPFAGSAVIDIDNDGTEELFLGGGPGQQDGLLRFHDDAFTPIDGAAGISKADATATFAAVVLDTDGNGFDDLLVTRGDGVWLHRNSAGEFTTKKLPLAIPADTTPMSVGVADLNRDGHFDLFVAGYIRLDLVEGQNIFNKEGYGGSSKLFLNNGDNTFTDVTESAGLGYRHNTFMGIFVDVDRDSDEDLVVAHDTGQVRTWQNQGDGTFVNTPNPSSDKYAYPMGIGVGDYDNNGLMDFAFSNVGSTPPNFMIRGDLEDDQVSNWKWMLFKNEGNFRFRDTADVAKVADYEFSWGMVLADLNLDGRQDLIVSENYIGLPPHKIPFLRLPGRLLMQTGAGEFAAVGEQAGVVNKRYSISPLTADFNGDGYLDIVHVNIADRPKAFLSNGGDAGYLQVRLPNDVASIAAVVRVTLQDGRVLTNDFVSGEGLGSEQTRVMTFGLDEQQATMVEVTYLDGTSERRSGMFRNQRVEFDRQ